MSESKQREKADAAPKEGDELLGAVAACLTIDVLHALIDAGPRRAGIVATPQMSSQLAEIARLAVATVMGRLCVVAHTVVVEPGDARPDETAGSILERLVKPSMAHHIGWAMNNHPLLALQLGSSDAGASDAQFTASAVCLDVNRLLADVDRLDQTAPPPPMAQRTSILMPWD